MKRDTENAESGGKEKYEITREIMKRVEKNIPKAQRERK